MSVSHRPRVSLPPSVSSHRRLVRGPGALRRRGGVSAATAPSAGRCRPHLLVVPLLAPFLALFLVLTGCGAPASSGPVPKGAEVAGSDGEGGQGSVGVLARSAAPAAPPAPSAPAARPVVPGSPAPSAPSALSVPSVLPTAIPGLGPETLAEIPADTRQAFVVTGRNADSNESTAVLYVRDAPDRGWTPATEPWAAHNGMEGWTAEHSTGDLRSPVGVFGLTDAGGRLPDPGSRLPYDEEEYFAVEGDGFFGEPLEGSFDYVVAINYNRVEGVSPIDHERPLGEDRGGGIWIHVDHGGPTQGCVSVSEERMKELLRTLDPAKKPVVVMGDKASLAR